MALSPEERERLLASLPEPIRQAVASRVAEADTVEAFHNLVRAEELEEELRPWVRLVQAGDAGAFEPLWKILKPRLRGVIRAALWQGMDHFDEVESRVLTALWIQRAEYAPSKGPYMTWARAIARNLARWYRPDGAKNVELNDDHPVPERAELPPSACYGEVLKLVLAERPHYALAFLFNKYLGWKPSRVVAELGELPLPQVVNRLQEEVVSHYSVLSGFGVWLASVRRGVEGSEETLASFVPGDMKPEAAINHWAGDTVRKVSKLVIGQAEEFLSLVCRLRAPSYERLSFLWCRFLRMKPSNLASLRDRLVMDILDMFCAAYLSLTEFSARELSNAVQSLRDQIFPAQFLRECERDDLVSDIALWRDRIQAMLLGPVRTGHVAAYSYLCGSLPGLTGAARNKKKKGGSNDAVRKSSVHG